MLVSETTAMQRHLRDHTFTRAACGCRRVARANSMSGSDGDVLVPMEAMGEAYSRLANHGRVGSAIKAGSA